MKGAKLGIGRNLQLPLPVPLGVASLSCHSSHITQQQAEGTKRKHQHLVALCTKRNCWTKQFSIKQKQEEHLI